LPISSMELVWKQARVECRFLEMLAFRQQTDPRHGCAGIFPGGLAITRKSPMRWSACNCFRRTGQRGILGQRSDWRRSKTRQSLLVLRRFDHTCVSSARARRAGFDQGPPEPQAQRGGLRPAPRDRRPRPSAAKRCGKLAAELRACSDNPASTGRWKE